MIPLHRAITTVALLTCILGGILVAYPLIHGHYFLGAVVAVVAVASFAGFRRLTTRSVGYSTRAAFVGAVIGLVVNVLARTEIGKPGAERTVGTQVALLLLVHAAGSLAAFFASYVRIALQPGRIR
jgi:hypothetical protein